MYVWIVSNMVSSSLHFFEHESTKQTWLRCHWCSNGCDINYPIAIYTVWTKALEPLHQKGLNVIAFKFIYYNNELLPNYLGMLMHYNCPSLEESKGNSSNPGKQMCPNTFIHIMQVPSLSLSSSLTECRLHVLFVSLTLLGRCLSHHFSHRLD